MRRRSWAQGLMAVLGITFAGSPAWAYGIQRESTSHSAEGASGQDRSEDTEKPDPCAQPNQCTKWYGVPILTMDLAAMVLGSIGVGSSSTGLILGSVGLFTLGGPIVHFSNSQIATGFGSLGLRISAPSVGGLVSFLVCNSHCTGDGCWGCIIIGGLGIFSGMLFASVVDNVVLARKPVRRARFSLSVYPTYQPTSSSKGLALVGSW
jgi:hypothetical protein